MSDGDALKLADKIIEFAKLSNDLTADLLAMAQQYHDQLAVMSDHLHVPWVGQNVATVNTDDFSNSDCGPACVAMWLAYWQNPRTVDEVSEATSLQRGYKSTAPDHLIRAAQHYGLTLKRAFNLTREVIAAQLQNLNPVIVLVHYGSLLRRYDAKYKAGHWIIVTGLDGDTVIYNDPLWQSAADGEAIRIAWSDFYRAMTDNEADGNKAWQGIVKA